MRRAVLAGSFVFGLLVSVPPARPESIENVRWTTLDVLPGRPGFTLLHPADTGLKFTNVLDELSSARNRTLENGAGVAAGDFDGDGRTDIFLCSLARENALFRNLGHWRFENVTTSAFPGAKFAARSAVFADINGDAAADLLVATLSDGVRAFTNSGAGRLIENPAAGLRFSAGVTTLALADIDRNGTLDLYVTTYRADDIRDRARIDIQRRGGKLMVAPALQDRIVLTTSGLFEFGEPDVLFLNDGKGNFRQADSSFFKRRTPQTKPDRDWGLAAAFRDMNADGWPDLYVCNDYWTPDRMWVNESGHFLEPLPEVLPHASENSMGVDFADINADGHLDIFVTDMLSRDPVRRHRNGTAVAALPVELAASFVRPHYMQNSLFLNRGDGTYAEISEFAGVSASEWSWQPVFRDIDLDGYPDLLIPAGHTRDVMDLETTERIRRLQHAWPATMTPEEMQRAFTRELMENARLYPRYDAPIVTFRNNGDLTFTDMTAVWGTDQPAIHQGLACADFDEDGDLDLVVNNLNSPAAIYRNNVSAHRVVIRLRGAAPNTEAIGVRLTLVAKNLPPQVHEITSGGRYLSGFDTECVFAASLGTNILRITVPGGREMQIPVQENRRYEVKIPAGRP